MNRRFVIVSAIASAIALACSRASGQMPATVAVANDPLLQHHQIRIDQLPKPYATPSSGNPPSVGAPPANATLHAPPGFHISLFADKLGDPRAMLLAPRRRDPLGAGRRKDHHPARCESQWRGRATLHVRQRPR